ncbi:pro-resilin-like [Leptidea sinapis]|uniref:pro-resilin-like n=1 Tax=Leptidea sinapis TaxID=189913 RepID=UPI00213D95C6|nr:pro-resilin-like [Leptidea sinapis]
MKSVVVFVTAIIMAVAEPPISKSYLPPPSNGFSQGPAGFQSGLPQVVAARSLAQSNNLGLSRSTNNNAERRFVNSRSGYEENRPSLFAARNSLESDEPAYYNFGYMVNDFVEGTDFGHHEERQEERANGGYHVVLPDGRKQTVSYQADQSGFKPRITYEDQDSEELTRSGYDANANNYNGFGRQNGGHGNHGNGRSGYY